MKKVYAGLSYIDESSLDDNTRAKVIIISDFIQNTIDFPDNVTSLLRNLAGRYPSMPVAEVLAKINSLIDNDNRRVANGT